MSLQMLNEEFQLELAQERRSAVRSVGGGSQSRGFFPKFSLPSIGSLWKKEYPSTRQLEEMLIGMD